MIRLSLNYLSDNYTFYLLLHFLHKCVSCWANLKSLGNVNKMFSLFRSSFQGSSLTKKLSWVIATCYIIMRIGQSRLSHERIWSQSIRWPDQNHFLWLHKLKFKTCRCLEKWLRQKTIGQQNWKQSRTDCILAAFWLLLDCILTAFWLHLDCILTGFWLDFDWILTEF